jgi:hypothetical protein
MATVENTTTNKEEAAFHGISQGESSIALFGQGAAVGVRGDGSTWHGVAGISTSTTGGAGVYGINNTGSGVIGESAGWMGVYGKTDSTTGGAGVMGEGGATGGPGVIGKSQHWHGVYGETSSPGATGAAAVWGDNKSDGSGVVGHSAGGAGVFGKSENGAAGVFDGRVEVTGDLNVGGVVRVARDVEVQGDVLLQGRDVAELFAVRPAGAAIDAEPGTLMSTTEGGWIVPSDGAYDRRVVGVVAGAGQFRPGVILGAGQDEAARPIAMIGRVYCKADASFGAIEIGDPLTTSPTAGHAMKAADAGQAFGAVVGKALGGLRDGQGLIPIVVSLR